MFSKLFRRDPVKKLQGQYDRKLYEAMQAQRNGNIREYSALTAQSEEILKQLESAKTREG